MTGNWIILQLMFVVGFACLILWHSLVVALARRAAHSAKIAVPTPWIYVMRANLVLMIIGVLLVLFVRP